MPNLETKILTELSAKNYQPLKPKLLARKLGLKSSDYGAFRKVLKELIRQGRVALGKNHTIRQSQPHGTATGVFRKTESGFGFVRTYNADGSPGPEIFVPERGAGDAATGDTVLVRIRKKPSGSDRSATGEISQVLERATHQFVGTYFERDGDSFVRVDGTVFAHSVYVGDPGTKGAKVGDKVVVEMLRFPSPEDRGEGVISEILGAHGQPGVDLLSIIRAYGLPESFPEDALEEARASAAMFDENHLHGREDFTGELTITIDPVDARDFDDAVSLTRDPKSRHWRLSVHIADVGHFAPHGGPLDREARKRGNSVYLPQKVLPMFPELLSNGLASLQQDRLRFVKSAIIDFTPGGQKTSVRFANGAIRNARRFTYEEVSKIFEAYDNRPADAKKKVDGVLASVSAPLLKMLLRMRELSMKLRARRFKRGALQLEMPEAELEYDKDGRMIGAHFVKHDVSHQLVEEFMLAANEAVADHFQSLGVPFLRRIHPSPEPAKLKAFAEFVGILGYKVKRETDRFELQRVLDEVAERPEVYAVNYSLLRSLKQAVYSPVEEGHYALAIDNYCHFTSPIRRYPDLVIHRMLNQWLTTGKAGSDETELAAIGEHCSKTERRADLAERDLVKLKLLSYLSERIGLEQEVIISGVTDYGFYAQAEKLPVEGFVHVSTLTDDYYYYDESSRSLVGKRTNRRYRLGDKVQVKVVRVDLQRRWLDFRVIGLAVSGKQFPEKQQPGRRNKRKRRR